MAGFLPNGEGNSLWFKLLVPQTALNLKKQKKWYRLTKY